MKKMFILLMIFNMSVLLFPQNINSKKTNTSQSKVSVSNSTSTISNVKTDSQDVDESSEVLIDSSVSIAQPESNYDEEGIPYQFGVLKGVLNFEGKIFLVFESDDGTISFIYVYRAGQSFKWKLYFQIRRV